MSIFHWLRGSDEEPRLSRDLIERLERIDERQRMQEKGLKSLELEWQEWFDKFRLMYARLSKRIKEAAAAVEESDGNGAQSRQDALETTKDLRLGYGQPPMHQRAQPGKRNY